MTVDVVDTSRILRPPSYGAGRNGLEEALDQVKPRADLGVQVSSKRPFGRVASQALVSLEMCAE